MPNGGGCSTTTDSAATKGVSNNDKEKLSARIQPMYGSVLALGVLGFNFGDRRTVPL